MVSFYTLAAAVAASVASVNAAPQIGVPPPDIHWWCYDGGRNWENVQAVLDHARNACMGWSGNRGHYQNVRARALAIYSIESAGSTWANEFFD